MGGFSDSGRYEEEILVHNRVLIVSDKTWELTSPMKDKRSYHTVTLLDGIIRFGRRRQSADKTLVRVESTSKSKTWTSTTPMKEGVLSMHGRP